MRTTRHSGVRSKSAHATVAVTSTAAMTPTFITQCFETVGFVIAEDDDSSNTRRDRAVSYTQKLWRRRDKPEQLSNVVAAPG